MATPTDPESAKSLIKEFQEQNKSKGEHALKTPEGHHLNGFFIHRETLESILSDKENTGVHVYLAKHPDFAGKPDNVPTLAVTGSKPNTATDALTPHVNTGAVYLDTPPCPTLCGNLAS